MAKIKSPDTPFWLYSEPFKKKGKRMDKVRKERGI